MTKERVLKVLKENIEWQNYTDGNDSWDSELKEAVTEAIKLIEQQSCDCVSRQALLEFVESKYQSNWWNVDEVLAKIKSLPPVTPVCGIATVHFSKEDLREICNERIEIACEHGTCKDCKWWETENRKIGYCNACKHGHCSGNWDIGIYRKTKDDFYCADFEKRGKANE